MILNLHFFAGRLVDADFLAVLVFEAYAVSLAGRSVEQRDVGDVNRHRLVDDTTLDAGHRVRLDSLLGHVDAIDDDVLGADDRRVKGDLKRFKEMIERRGTATGAWRGEVDQGETR